MPDIGNYTAGTQLVLVETGKYFALLLFCVLAIRLWRRWAKIPAARNAGGLLTAGAATVMVGVIGCVAMRHSLGSLYSYYGMQAFREQRLPQARLLFETAVRNWRNANTLGQQGVCLLLLGEADRGLALIAQARALRNGRGAPFEDFYEGLYLFNQGDVRAAIPLLQASSTDDTYRWSVTKLFTVMALDENHVAEAAERMKPFREAEVTEFDQAYIVASLELADGNQPGARALLEKFSRAGLSPRWQARFEKLRGQLRD